MLVSDVGSPFLLMPGFLCIFVFLAGQRTSRRLESAVSSEGHVSGVSLNQTQRFQVSWKRGYGAWRSGNCNIPSRSLTSTPTGQRLKVKEVIYLEPRMPQLINAGVGNTRSWPRALNWCLMALNLGWCTAIEFLGCSRTHTSPRASAIYMSSTVLG